VRHFLARLDDVPVGTAALLVAEGVAGIYNVATLAEARGRGIGSLLTAHTLQIARSAGISVAILKASQMGFNVYKRLGFETVCTFNHYVFRSAPRPRG
jgi:predicted acetyltransferase